MPGRPGGTAPASAVRQALRPDLPHADQDKTLIHISSGDPIRIEASLGSVERLLASAADKGRNAQVELLADNEGLALLISSSPHAEHIDAIASAHSNIRFIACETRMDRAAGEPGTELELNLHAQRIDDALTETSEKLNQG